MNAKQEIQARIAVLDHLLSTPISDAMVYAGIRA
jgi:hypothetical protein